MKVNWFQVITDLQRNGYTYAHIGKKIDVTDRTIGNWKCEICEPPHSKGEKLLEIYRSVVKST